MLLCLVPALVIGIFSSPSWASIFGTFVGTILYGAAMLSIGVFISSMTVSQVVSAIVTFIVSVLMLMINSLAGMVPVSYTHLDVYKRQAPGRARCRCRYRAPRRS